MAEKFVILDKWRMGAWDAFVREHAEGSVYHTSAWQKVIEAAYEHEPLYFALENETGCIVAGLPTFLVRSFISGTRLSSLPCAQSCNPLAAEERYYRALREGILEHMKAAGVSIWELKTMDTRVSETYCSDASTGDYITHRLRIDRPVTELSNGLHASSVKRAISRARRSGLEVRRCSDRAEVRQFVGLYSRMRREKGLLPQPERFFESIWDFMRGETSSEILFADYGGRPVSGILLLKYKDTVVYEYGATEEGFHRLSPSPLLLWEAIVQASRDGYRIFDFGRSAVSDEGLIRFKGRWGAQQRRLPYYEMGCTARMSSLRSDGSAKAAMAFAMRILPAPVCNVAGRLLYRHLV